MSNPTDPKKPGPDPHDPHANEQTGTGSQFEFTLPDADDALRDLPPIPPPDAGLNGTEFALPPPPVARDSRGSFGDFGLNPLPSSEDALALPDPPAAGAPGDSAVLLEPPAAPPLDRPALTLEPADLPGVTSLFPPEPDARPGLPGAADDALAEIDLGADEGHLPAGPGGSPAAPGSVPDLSSLRPAPGASGSTPELPVAPAGHRGGSSFEFQLPDEVGSYSEMPPIPEPDEIGSKSDFGVLPPRPAAGPRDASFDFINVTGSRSFADIGSGARPLDPDAGTGAAPPAPDSSKVGIGNFEPVSPITPASGWLDAEEGPPAADAGPEADLSALPATDLIESSNIFASSAGATEPIGNSDVLAATAGGPPFGGPNSTETMHPAEVPFALSELVGDADGDLSDLPLADALDNSAELEVGGDDESIHDMPAPSENPLFDSGPLVQAQDLPPAPGGGADATDYGAPPVIDSDASSILADLSTPEFHFDDASSVRVEAPGVDRTLTGEPVDAAFELTVPDEPLPAGLFGAEDDPDDGANTALTDWQEASDTDLRADQPLAPSGTSAGTKLGPQVEADAAAEDLEFADYEPTAVTESVLPGAPAPSAKADGESDLIDFDDVEAVGGGQRTYAAPQDVSLSAILRGELPDDSEEIGTRPATPRLGSDANAPTRTPEASVDFLAESAEGSAIALPLQAPSPAKGKGKDKEKSKSARLAGADDATAKTRPSRPAPARAVGTGTAEKVRPTKKGGIVVGALVGALAAGSAFAGIYFGGVIPNSEKVAVGPRSGPVASDPGVGPAPAAPTPAAPAPAALDPQAAFAAGEGAKALEHYKTNPPANLTEKAAAGYIRLFTKVQALQTGAAVAANDADLTAARTDLEAVIADPGAVAEPGGVMRGVRASVALGVSYEIAGDAKAARKVYTDAMSRYPAYRSTFEALIDKLDAQGPPAAGTSLRLAPADAERLLFATALLLQDAQKAEDAEPGVYYWKAVSAASGGKYADAIELIERAKAAHIKRARAVAGRGLNPLSDPLEQIFTRSCDELKAHWKLRGAVSGNPDMIAAVKKDGGALAKALDALTGAADAAARAEKEATAARATVKKLEGEAEALAADVKATNKAKLEAEKALAAALTDLKAREQKLETAAAELKATEKEVTAQKDVLTALADALRPAAPVPEKWGPGDLLAATKSVVSRATGPDLKALVPNAMVAVGGGGLAAGQLIEISDRLTKAEAAAKAAAAQLATETKRLTEKYDTDTKKLKDDGAAEAKKLTDAYAAGTKKLSDEHADALKKLKAGSAEELKALADKYAADAKKLSEEHAAAAAKLKEGFAAALKTEQDRTEAEKKKAQVRELEFQKQLAGAVTPGQVMDIWLPVLTDLRRASDAGPALAAAEKAVASSAPGSEDAAKAHTVAGLAHLIRGDLARAKEQLGAARRSPAYKDAAGKPWAVAADNGSEAVADPAAQYRQPVALPATDLKAAAAALDAGISAYKAGRYDAAARALLDATKSNSVDPVAWYFLGAARWAQGAGEQAQKDFVQGAERERASAVPNHVTSAALAPIQGAARDALDRTRP